MAGVDRWPRTGAALYRAQGNRIRSGLEQRQPQDCLCSQARRRQGKPDLHHRSGSRRRGATSDADFHRCRIGAVFADGYRIAFTSSVYPAALNDTDSERLAKEEKERKFKARAYTSYPIRDWDKWIDGKQSHIFVQKIGEQDARDLLAESALIKQPGFALAKGAPRWTPDGQAVVFAASRNRNRAAYAFINDDLWMVPMRGGEPRRLTGAEGLDGGDSWSSPRFSRDGRHLFALVDPRTDKVYNARQLDIFEWPSMRDVGRIRLPEGREMTDFALSPDGTSVDLLGGDAGQVKLYRAPTRAGEARLVGAPAHGAYSNLEIGGSRSAVTIAAYQSATEPPEIVRLNSNGREFRLLTSAATSRAAALDLPPVENFWFTNQRGQRIHNMIVRPPTFDPAKVSPSCSCTADLIRNGRMPGCCAGTITCYLRMAMCCC